MYRDGAYNRTRTQQAKQVRQKTACATANQKIVVATAPTVEIVIVFEASICPAPNRDAIRYGFTPVGMAATITTTCAVTGGSPASHAVPSASAGMAINFSAAVARAG